MQPLFNYSSWIHWSIQYGTVDSGLPVGFYQIPNVLAKTIENMLENASMRLLLLLAECRGQWYDAASKMLGKNSQNSTLSRVETLSVKGSIKRIEVTIRINGYIQRSYFIDKTFVKTRGFYSWYS